MEYCAHILVLVGIYTILAVSLNLIAGYTGLLSIAHAAFYGVGAYVAALMVLKLHTPFYANIVCAVVLSGVLGALVGIPFLRIRDDCFVIATFAFQVIIFSILNNWVSLTGGPMGLPGIPRPTICGQPISSYLSFLTVVGVLCALTLWVTHRIVRSPLGRVLMAIREDEVFAQVAGKNVATCKVLVFVVGGGLAAVAGVIYAYYVSFIDPTSFTVMESILILSMVIIGGTGSMWGPLVGAVVLVTLPEALRFVGLPTATAANLRQIIYGALLVVMMMARPQGLVGRYAFGR